MKEDDSVSSRENSSELSSDESEVCSETKADSNDSPLLPEDESSNTDTKEDSKDT